MCFQSRLGQELYDMGLNRRILLIMTCAVLMATSCRQREEVDLIIRNAKIYTVNNNFAVLQSAAIHNGRFVAVGSDANIGARYTSDSVLDLRGKFVYPGFIDAHAHFVEYAKSLAQVDLEGAESLNAVFNRLTKYRNIHPGEWIVARNLSYTSPDDAILPDNTTLNVFFKNIPVFIWTKDYKRALVNDAFLKAAGIEPAVKDGYIESEMVRSAARCLPQPSDSAMAELLKQAERNCFNVGITGTTNFGSTIRDVRLIDSLRESGELQIPVYIVLEPSAENIEQYISKMPINTDRQKVLAVGIDIDGRMSQYTAVTLQPLAEGKTNGRLRITPDSLRRLCQMAYEHGFQMCVGCVGDSAARLTLKTYADILPNKNPLRWRIENLHLIAHNDLKYFSHYNIIPSVQPAQYQYNKSFISENLDRRHKKEVFAWKQLLSQNQGIVSGSNAPYGSLNPTEMMYYAMSQEKRRTYNKQNQKMTPTQALKSLTIWAAYSQFDEQQRGSIEVGKWADFVVVGKNITTMYQPELPQVSVERTYVRGKRVK